MNDCIISHYTPGNVYPTITRGRRTHTIARVLCGMTYNLPQEGDWHTRHTCDNPRCVNIAHLKPGTHADNMRDKVKRGRAPCCDWHGMTKLSWEQVRAIRASSAKGVDLAKQYGISPKHVSRIKRNETWKET